MAKNKYFQKSEFRDYINPKHLSKNKKPHKAYISVKSNNAYKFNVITHSSTFFGEDTKPLKTNPKINSKDIRQSKVSVPRWANKSNFGKTIASKTKWHMTKQNKTIIKKWNKQKK
jgi:hypothetical protein